jgi:hypothetical protein
MGWSWALIIVYTARKTASFKELPTTVAPWPRMSTAAQFPSVAARAWPSSARVMRRFVMP